MKINNLFPTPVGAGAINKKLSAKEIKFLVGQPMRHNIHNLVSENNYILESQELSGLRKELLEIARTYFKIVYAPQDGVDIYITQSWVNITKPEQAHHIHAHQNSFLSGVFYVDTAETDIIKFHRDSPSISSVALNLEPTEWNPYNSKSWWYPTPTGGVFIFPSGLIHEVPPTTSGKDRVSLAFNMFLKGRLGNSAKLSELML